MYFRQYLWKYLVALAKTASILLFGFVVYIQYLANICVKMCVRMDASIKEWLVYRALCAGRTC